MNIPSWEKRVASMKIIKSTGVFIASCFIYFWLYKNILFDYIYGRLREYSSLIENPISGVVFILLASVFTLLVYHQISQKKIHVIFVWCFYLSYILLTGYIFLGRYIVFRGIELNPLAFISYFRQRGGSEKNFSNILFFVPYGILLHKIPPRKSLPLSLLGILAIETGQYIFKVGVFDLSDVLLNIAGIYLGENIGVHFANKGVKVVKTL
jgi:glycopeptide antibiotics resistance protein